MPIELTKATRANAVWLAIDEKNRIIGKVPHREFIQLLHRYVDEMERGMHLRFPPQMQLNGVPCRFEPLFPPQGMLMPRGE